MLGDDCDNNNEILQYCLMCVLVFVVSSVVALFDVVADLPCSFDVRVGMTQFLLLSYFVWHGSTSCVFPLVVGM